MEKSVAKNYIYNLIYELVAVIAPLITMPYISRIFGVERIGAYSYIFAVVTYFAMVARLGLDLYGRRQIAYVRDDRGKTTGLFWRLFHIRVINFLLVALIYCLVLLPTGNYKLYYTIFLIYIFAGMIDISWLYQAYEEFGLITLRNTIIKVINVLCVFAFVRSRDSLWKYVLLVSVSEFVSQASLWIGLSKRVDVRHVPLKGTRELYKGAFTMFLPQIITTIYTVADKIILGLLSTEAEVGSYSQSEKIIKMTLVVISSMGAVAMPRISSDYAKGNKDKIISRLYNNRRLIYFLALPMIGGVIGISEGMVPWFFGPGYEQVAVLMPIISPIILFIALSDLYGMQFLVPTSHMREYTLSAAGGAVANVILNIILVKRYAAVGVSIATVVSELLVTVMMRRYARGYIHFPKVKVWPYAVSALLMSVAVKFADTYNPGKAVWIFCEILLGVVLYFALLLLMKDEMLMELLRKVKGYGLPWRKGKGVD